jgi:hypothetical protein
MPALKGTAIAHVMMDFCLFNMFCFWEGEAKLGALPGVRSTLAGSCPHHPELVKVNYDPDVTTPMQLAKVQLKFQFVFSLFFFLALFLSRSFSFSLFFSLAYSLSYIKHFQF